MTKTNNNVRSFSGYSVWYGALGTALPSDLATDLSTLGLSEVGLLSDGGVTEAHSYGNETSIYDMSGSLIRVLRSQEARTFTFTALETNPNVDTLLYPGSSASSSGATAEVQQVVLTGATGGTFNLTLPGYGSATGLAYNISNSALASALSGAFGGTVTVAGTSSTYNVTFGGFNADVPQLTYANNLTGTTPSIAVSTTTPGVPGTVTQNVGAATGRYLRAWVIDLQDGTYHERYVINNGEASQSGDVQKTSSGAAEYAFSLDTYKDSSGNFFVKLHN